MARGEHSAGPASLLTARRTRAVTFTLRASLPIGGEASLLAGLDFLQGFRDSAHTFFAANKSKASD
jgi:hypothetical protein